MTRLLAESVAFLVWGSLLLAMLSWLTNGKRAKLIHRVSSCGMLLLVGAAMLLLVVKLLAPEFHTTRIFFGHWLTLGNESVDLTLTVDPPAAVLLLLFTLSSAAFWFHQTDSAVPVPTEAIHRPQLFLLLSGGMLVVMADHLIGLIIAWQILNLAEYLWVGRNPEAEGETGLARDLFFTQRIGDCLLLLATFLFWREFDSLRFPIFLQNRELVEITAAEGSGIRLGCFCLCAAVGLRCAVVPFPSWLRDSQWLPISTRTLIHAVCFPAGCFLLIRFWPLLSMVPEIGFWLIFLGSLTTLLLAFSAAEVSLGATLGYLTPACYGLLFLALGTGTPAGLHTAMTGLVAVSLIQISCFLLVHNVERVVGTTEYHRLHRLRHSLSLSGNLFSLNGILLFSGVWTVLVITAGIAAPTETEFGKTLLLTVVFLGVLLAAGAFARAVWLTFDTAADLEFDSPPEPIIPQPWRSWLPSTLLTGTLLFLMVFVLEPDFLWKDQHEFVDSPAAWKFPNADLFWMVCPVVSLLLLGVVVHQLKESNSARPGRKPVRWVLPFPRLKALACFGWGFPFFLNVFLVKPVRGLSQVLRFLDFFIVDLMLLRVLGGIPRVLTAWVTPLNSGSVSLAQLSISLSVAVLLLLFWLGG